MMFGMAAAASALDLINTLTKPQGTSKTNSPKGFEVGARTQTSTVQTAQSQGLGSLIAPGTMNALFAAQNGSDASATSPSSALKSLFGQIDGDGNGQISKAEFQSALGASGTNLESADKVFGKLDSDGDGNVSMAELAAALKPKKKPHGLQHRPQDLLLQSLDSANAAATTNGDGTKTTSSPIALSEAARSYDAVSRMRPHLADMLAKNASTSSSVSVSV